MNVKQGAVFLTSKSWEHGKDKLAQNNYLNGADIKKKEGRLDRYIKIWIPEEYSYYFVEEANSMHNVVACLYDIHSEELACWWGHTDKQFSLCSFNVHFRASEEQLRRAAAFLNGSPAEIVCLQECQGQNLQRLGSHLSYSRNVHKGSGVSIISDYPQSHIVARGSWPGQRGWMTVEIPELNLYVTNVHLNSKYEKQRCIELDEIITTLRSNNIEPTHKSMIWAGDFNSLKRGDYTAERWAEVGKERSRSRLEKPLTAVTDKMAGIDYSDCWYGVNSCGQLGSCR